MEEPLNPKGKTPRIVKTPPKVVEIKRKKHAMSVLDTLLALVTVTPLVISHWRGTWVLMDIYNESFPIWESFFLGVSLHFSFALMKDGLRDLIHRGQKTRMQQVHAFFLRRLYTYLFTCACILHWRAGWVVFDDFFAIELRDDGRAKKGIWGFVVVAATVIFAGVLCAMKSFRNVLTTPFMIGLDTKGTCFNFPTRFQQNMEEKKTLYVLDCLFSVLIVGTLVVFVWRGAWVIIDIYLFPENEIWSAWASLVLGYSCVALTFLMQPAMRWLCDRAKGAARILIADIFLLFSFVGTVNVWRGIWNLLNLYFLPDDMELSCWITHWACLILLILLKCSNTLLVRGVYIDADEPAGKCVVFPIYYLRLIFQHERAKKISKKLQLEAMTRRKLELETIKTTCTCGAEIKNHVTKETSQNEQNHHPGS